MKTGFSKIVNRVRRVSTVTLVATFLLVLGAAVAWALVPHPPDWADPIPDAETYGVAADSNGNVYVAGWDGSGDDNRFMVTKYNSTGTVEWRTTETVGWANDIAVDSNDDVIATGRALGVFRTVKYDPDGNELWSKDHNVDSTADGGRKLVVDGHDNVYIVGAARTTAGEKTRPLIIKYDTRGKEKWAASYGEWLPYRPRIAVDDNEDVYISDPDNGTVKLRGTNGQQLWIRDVGPPWGEGSGVVVQGDYVYTLYTWEDTYSFEGQILTKYDLDGDMQWETTYTGEGDYEGKRITPVDLGVDDNGNVYTTAFERGYGWYVTVKHEPTSGTVEWDDWYNGPSGAGWFYAYHMAVDGSGNSYVTGQSKETTAVPWTGYDIWTVKYDTSGTLEWADGYDDGASSNENNFDGNIAVDSNGVYIAGGQGGGNTGPVLKYALD